MCKCLQGVAGDVKAEGEAGVFQHLLRDLAKVNALKNNVPVIVIFA